MAIDWYEIQSNGSLIPITLNEIQSSGSLIPLTFTETGDFEAPDPPVIAVDQTSRTSATVTITGSSGGALQVNWVILRDGVAVATLPAATTTFVDSPLPTATPERIFNYQAQALGTSGQPSGLSNTVTVQWSGTPAQPPSAPTGLTASAITDTGFTVSWSEAAPTGAAIASHTVRYGTQGTVLKANVGASVRTTAVTGLTQATTYSGVYVTRTDVNGLESGPSNTVTVKTTGGTQPSTTMLMGTSDAGNGQGGFANWDVWRLYTRSAMLQHANDTGSARPKAIAYSEDGAPLGSSGTAVTTVNYQQIFNHVLSELNSFYYTTDTGQTHTARWGISLYWSNGNENTDKGIIFLASNAPANSHTATQIADYTTSMRALYDACHFVDPTTNQRRFPDAYAGSDPTQNHEQSGWVDDVLSASAQYHDFVAWSMYPPGRQTTVTDPTFNWPSFSESRRTNLQDGFLIRCFYRTKQIEAAARQQTGDPARRVQIHCWEVGIGQDPSDSTTRPYYAVHGLAGAMFILAQQYDLDMPVACWWDNAKDAASPQNMLSDEPSTTNPSTATAWRGWIGYDHRRGGTHPTSWSGNPKAAWKQTGSAP